MKKSWLILSILPVFVFAQMSDDLLKEEPFLHIVFEDEEDFDGSGFPLPWDDEVASEGPASYIESKSRMTVPDFDDVFCFDVQDQKTYEPTQERVSEQRRRLSGRPKVVPSPVKGKNELEVQEPKGR